MPLVVAPVGKDVRVVKILADEKTKKHLENLGITIDSVIRVISASGGILPGVAPAEEGALVVAGYAEVDFFQEGVYGGGHGLSRGAHALEVGLDAVCASLGVSAEGFVSASAASCRAYHRQDEQCFWDELHVFGKVFAQSYRILVQNCAR